MKHILGNKTLSIVVAGLFIVLGHGCRQSPSEKTYRVAFSQCCSDPWRDVMNSEMYRELTLHPELEFVVREAGNNSENQISQIRELVASKIDLLIVSPNEASPLTPIIEEVYRQNIPVILIDRKTDSERYTAFVGADNFEIGKTAGKYIANQFEGQGKILEIQLGMTMTPARERNRGFLEAIREYPGMEVIGVLEQNVSATPMEQTFPDLLAAHPEANIVFGHTDFFAESAYHLAKEQRRAEGLFFVGIDGIPGVGQGIQAVEDDILDASLLYPTGGSEAIRLAVDILEGRDYKKQNDLQTIVIDRNNAEILHSQMKKVESLQKNIDNQLMVLEDLRSVYSNQRTILYLLLGSLFIAVLLGLWSLKLLRERREDNRRLATQNEEILAQQKRIVEVSEKAEEAHRAKVRFFTNISHEFRTPLTLILGHLEGILSAGGGIPKEVRQDIQLVRGNALRLLRLINQLMDFRKIENNKMEVRAGENDLVLFVRNVFDAYRKIADKRNIDFRLFLHEEKMLLWFDQSMLDKVLFNLLSNAFKFTKDGGKIHLSIERDPFQQQAILKVEDDGRGMSPEHVRHAFDRYYQGATNPSKGTGLGLALSRELIELHCGEIQLWSDKGVGTRFEIRLPLGKEHFREEQLIPEQADMIDFSEHIGFVEYENRAEIESDASLFSTSSENDEKQTLLLIEDNADLLSFLMKKLGAYYRIITAADGNEGLNTALEKIPDLILSDIGLPGINGLELSKKLKTDLRTSHIPIVLLTARTTMDQKIQGIQTGADAYVTKPFNFVFLTEVIKNLLHGRELLRARFNASYHPPRELPGASKLDQEFVQKFTLYLNTHFAEQDLTVEKISEAFNLSRVQLYRKVKALFGNSVNDQIQHTRLLRASQLLKDKDTSIAEIAYQVGYSSPAYFSTAFKGKYHCSPSEWRDRKEH